MNESEGICVNGGVINRGNLNRLKGKMKKAEAGEKIVIGFIGGSITQGSLSSSSDTCYAYLIYKWWREKFPKSEFAYINAGIGGTTSQFGVVRVQEDLLKYEPDFVIVEFSVNDENNGHFAETYEGLVRNIYRNGNRPAILLLHNVRYDNGMNAQEEHAKIGKAYGLPCISMKEAILSKVISGEIPVQSITPDDLHPNDAGHELVAQTVIEFLEEVYTECSEVEVLFGNGRVPEPITANRYEHSLRYRNDNCVPKCCGFKKDTKKYEKNPSIFQKGWTANSINDRIMFEIEGTGVAIQYRKSICKPAPVARAVIDGKEELSILLDGNFDEDWGDCLYIDTVAEDLEDKVHTVEITVVEISDKPAVPFYLVSVIGSR
ncbi:MAG: SGNH/GDSL hydrolase family protein [Clostridiales bacterium]|nr:SGNH/GDSL hydrolase family protein [Clostridiales bacterium]